MLWGGHILMFLAHRYAYIVTVTARFDIRNTVEYSGNSHPLSGCQLDLKTSATFPRPLGLPPRFWMAHQQRRRGCLILAAWLNGECQRRGFGCEFVSVQLIAMLMSNLTKLPNACKCFIEGGGSWTLNFGSGGHLKAAWGSKLRFHWRALCWQWPRHPCQPYVMPTGQMRQSWPSSWTSCAWPCSRARSCKNASQKPWTDLMQPIRHKRLPSLKPRMLSKRTGLEWMEALQISQRLLWG